MELLDALGFGGPFDVETIVQAPSLESIGPSLHKWSEVQGRRRAAPRNALLAAQRVLNSNLLLGLSPVPGDDGRGGFRLTRVGCSVCWPAARHESFQRYAEFVGYLRESDASSNDVPAAPGRGRRSPQHQASTSGAGDAWAVARANVTPIRGRRDHSSAAKGISAKDEYVRPGVDSIVGDRG